MDSKEDSGFVVITVNVATGKQPASTRGKLCASSASEMTCFQERRGIPASWLCCWCWRRLWEFCNRQNRARFEGRDLQIFVAGKFDYHPGPFWVSFGILKEVIEVGVSSIEKGEDDASFEVGEIDSSIRIGISRQISNPHLKI